MTTKRIALLSPDDKKGLLVADPSCWLSIQGGAAYAPPLYCQTDGANSIYYWTQPLSGPIHMGRIISLSSWERMWQCQT